MNFAVRDYRKGAGGVEEGGGGEGGGGVGKWPIRPLSFAVSFCFLSA